MSKIDKALNFYKENGFKATGKKVLKKVFFNEKKERAKSTRAWMEVVMPSEEELSAQRNTKFSYEPKFSIVVPLYKTPDSFLVDLVSSLKNQTYVNWELCLSDGSGENSPLTDKLKRLAEEDSRIKAVHNENQLHISENTNAGLEVATGDFIGFADHDDSLAPNALYEYVKALNENADIDMFYSDECILSEDGRDYISYAVKPDYCPDLLRSYNYITHFCVVRRSIIEDMKPALDSRCDGAQDYDFILRVTERTSHIYHVAKPLYFWRSAATSVLSGAENKTYAIEAGRAALSAHLGRIGLEAEVSCLDTPFVYKVDYKLMREPLVSIIIPNKDHAEDLGKCVRSIVQKSTYKNIEFIVAENNSTEEATFSFYEELKKEVAALRVVRYEGAFNFSKIVNFGAQQASGEYLLLLNNDTEMINADSIGKMVSVLNRSDVGTVGAKLLYADNTIQHCGVVVGIEGYAAHVFLCFPAGHSAYPHKAAVMSNYSAVTGACLMTKKALYDEVGGFSEEFAVAANDVDYCLKVQKKEMLTVMQPDALFYHYESKSRGYEDTPEKKARFKDETGRFREKWSEFFEKGDPCYNINLGLGTGDFTIETDIEALKQRLHR